MLSLLGEVSKHVVLLSIPIDGTKHSVHNQFSSTFEVTPCFRLPRCSKVVVKYGNCWGRCQLGAVLEQVFPLSNQTDGSEIVKELFLLTGNVVLYGLNGVAKWSSDTGNVGRVAYLKLLGNETLELRYKKGSMKKVL